MNVFAIDPGPVQSGWALYDPERRCVVTAGVQPNDQLLLDLPRLRQAHVAIEMIASYGMAVGAEVFGTCVWIGRFQQACMSPDQVILVLRKDVKLHICQSPRAKDTNVRQALIDRLGPPGTKKDPGPTYGIRSHAWPAIGVAITAAETRL